MAVYVPSQPYVKKEDLEEYLHNQKVGRIMLVLSMSVMSLMLGTLAYSDLIKIYRVNIGWDIYLVEFFPWFFLLTFVFQIYSAIKIGTTKIDRSKVKLFSVKYKTNEMIKTAQVARFFDTKYINFLVLASLLTPIILTLGMVYCVNSLL